MRHFAFAACIAALTLQSVFPAGAQEGPAGPRFVSLKAEAANGRQGPSLEHRIEWIYARAGLPLEVLAQSGPWRRVRDPGGAETWMHARNLEARRTVYVPAGPNVALRRNPQSSARTVALLAPGVVGALTACRGDWRRVAVGGRVGWAHKDALWAGQDCTGV